tara:strand:+ start:321 stop:1085 length:765 start_codon:yes stop_codon:yes gene_type:complete
MNTNADKDNVNELSLFAQKRLLKDIKNIHCDKTLKDNGVYYVHSMSEMAKGYALIIGPEDSPYQHGAYLFEIVFPDNYPHSPPKFKYLTNDGKTRYHPNLYTNGKVCLSILNTWKGDQWTSSITLSHILLDILSILTKDALLHEPGITLINRRQDVEDYDTIIEYKNIYFSICEFASVKSGYFKSETEELHKLYREYVKNKKDRIKDIVTVLKERENTHCIGTSIYGLSKVFLDYDLLFNRYQEAIEEDEYYSK